MTHCKTCSIKLGARNKSGYCRKHIAAQVTQSPEWKARQREGIRRGLQENPERLEQYRKAARKASRSPAAVKARKERWSKERVWEKGVQAAAAPEVRAKAGKSISATAMSWCPPHLRAMYRDLTQTKRLKAKDARRLVLEHEASEIAALRRRMNYQEPEVAKRGRPQVWPDCPASLRPEYDRLRRKGVSATEARCLLENVA